ncbi:hypothetical protein ACLKA7_013803 [Drosophila subpalustris]
MQTESQEKTPIKDLDELKLWDGQLSGQSKKHNNNHHVVPLGILIVLSTIYLMIAGLQINYNYYFKSRVEAVKISEVNNDSHEENVFLHLERNHVEQPLCRKIEIFKMKEANETNEISQPPTKRQRPIKSTNKIEHGSTEVGTGGKQSRALNRKKDITKKPNTAEPIIYLFALVFIYLLLKAASDINQHYKSNKGDKRLRRCSLQSYAQKDQRNAHQDRRASKVAPLPSRHNIFTEVRSVSLDRCRRNQITIADHSRTYPTPGNLHLEPRSSRRLSVPISINYQTVNMSPIVHPELGRRGSVLSLGSTSDMNLVTGTNPLPLTAINPDTKRRVRMINRH